MDSGEMIIQSREVGREAIGTGQGRKGQGKVKKVE